MRDDEVLAQVVLAPNDDMGVRLARVVVIDSDPIELGVEVALHLRHEVPDEGLEVLQAAPHPQARRSGGTGDGRSSHSSRNAVPFGFIEVAAVELTRLALGRHAIALDVAQMSTGSPEIARLELGDARLDDDAALVRRDRDPPQPSVPKALPRPMCDPVKPLCLPP